jgi:hypothetical protein
MNPIRRLFDFAKYRSKRYLEHIEMLPLNQGFIKGYGYLNTILIRMPCDAKNQPMPWFTYSAVEYLDSIDLSQAVIFEWGSGNSSKYFASRCLSIESIESDKSWYDKQLQSISPNQSIVYLEEKLEQYPLAILNSKYESYDLIIVDGKQRYKCMTQALPKVKPSGLILLDNSDWYPSMCSSIRDLGFIQIDFHGYGPINKYTWTTSIFIKTDCKSAKESLLHRRHISPYYSKEASVVLAEDDYPLHVDKS